MTNTTPGTQVTPENEPQIIRTLALHSACFGHLGLAVLLLVLGHFTGPLHGAGTLNAEKLRCEYKFDPIGAVVSQPRFSWILTAVDPAQRGLRQSAYRILVASSSETLQQDRGDLWDSGKVASDQSVNIEYAGAALRSEQDCFWKVRAWDRDGQASDWSAVSRWTMGLLKPADW